MRILHTAATYSPSLDGVAEIVRNISERLAQRGHDVHVATTDVGSQSSCDDLRGVHVHRFAVKGNLAHGMRGQVQQYRGFVRSGHWDLLVNHCLQTWPTDALLDEIGAYPWPSVLVTQGLSIRNPLFDAYYLEIPRYISKYRKWVRVSNVSEEAHFAKQFNIPLPPIITNGVDLNEWTRPPLGLRQAWRIHQKPWIVNVSNHNPLKNHRLFFRLTNRLRGLAARFTLIGGTYPMSKWSLGRLGISGGCPYECRLRTAMSFGEVDLRTNLDRSHVVSAIQEADILVSTSKWEANSIVLLESMAAGTPWVSFDVGSARENAGGVVAGNLGEMADTITELLRDPDRRESLGRIGRARVVAEHDWEPITDQYERLYESVIGYQIQTCPR
jgi:L-malate glycosyltransferase